MNDADALLAEARAWLENDPDPETRAELSALIDGGNLGELRERFGAPLEFGTAGLRGVVGAGPSRMNQSVVERTSRAVAGYLWASDADLPASPVVIGYDARPTSRPFAEAAIRVLCDAGVTVRYFVEPCPTPLVAFAARELSAAAAIVVTASHNPAEYNGYKLYGSSAVQIVPPVDADIERRIREEGRAPAPIGRATASATPVSAQLVEEYLARLDRERPESNVCRSLSIVYTPLHGVGGALATRALARAGFTRVAVVPEQAVPDGAFPTTPSPNPEDPGTLSLSLALARELGADLILANDPDADRLAVCVPSPGGGHRALTGNQIGLLLADFVLERAPSVPRPLVVSTIVSSPMLALLARERGARYEATLTGFKWIWSAALSLEESEGVRFAFGYEEAIGFSVGRAVRDKDGISAAVWFAELAAHSASKDESVLDRLAALYRRHGLWVSAQHGVTRRGPDGAREIAASLNVALQKPPAVLAGRAVRGVVDYRTGAERRPPWLPATPLLLFDLGLEGRVLLRPSGTEPKLKIYVDLRRDVATTDALWELESVLEGEARVLAREFAEHIGLA